MTRTPTGKCSGCARPMWTKAGTPAPELCRQCRAQRPRATRGMGLTRTEAAARAHAASLILVERVCADCPAVFMARQNRQYCDPCRAGRQQDRSRRKNRSRLGYQKAIRSFPIRALGDRDQWTCHLCGGDVDPKLKSRHPGMASYDHKVPTSRGGSDEPENLALAHLICNVRRGATLL